MKLIIAGSRTITDRNVVHTAILESRFTPFHVEVVTGGASGVDTIVRDFASEYTHIAYREFPADWDEHGRAAGPIRNAEMAEYADALLAIWDGESAGTRDMIEKALEAGLDVDVVQVPADD